MNTFVFSHGFAFDHTYWDPILSLFPSAQKILLDRGYFGEKVLLPSTSGLTGCIGIGHSLGFLHLLTLPVTFRALIGLQPFANFLGNDLELRKQRTIEYRQFKRQFQNDPKNALDRFYKQCGQSIEEEKKERLMLSPLFEDLLLLSSSYNLGTLPIPILVLSSLQDPIVPKQLVSDNFLPFQNVTIRQVDSSNHSFFMDNTDEVLQEIKRFVHECS
jgi:pimeloyl-[acyl-carrier protein] methyl ester esterase